MLRLLPSLRLGIPSPSLLLLLFSEVLFSALPLLISGASFSSMTDCNYSLTDDTTGSIVATYDVSSLRNDYGMYALTDSYTVSEKSGGTASYSYSYMFNICKNVSSDDLFANCSAPVAGAYQVNGADSQFCQSLGSLDDATFMLLSEYNGMSFDPSLGVVLTYTGGDVCGITGQPRVTRIVIECSNSENIPDDEEMEEQHRQCEYVLQLPSKAGCPLQCPLGGLNRDLCSGRGVCGYDKVSTEVRLVSYG